MEKSLIQKINKGLSTYQFHEVEAVIIKRILRDARIKTIKNKFINSIIGRKTNADIDSWLDLNAVTPNVEILEKLYELNVDEKDRKINGSYYTPTKIISYIINETINHEGTVYDPACGSGAFLVETAKYFKKKFKIPYKKIFENYIYGVDILPKSVERAKILLSLLAVTEKEDQDFNFQIFEGDALTFDWNQKIKFFEGFDFAIGNPPYVRTKNLRQDVREGLKKWHTANSGNVDLYIPFFEVALKNVNDNGRVGFITPSTYLTSLNARRLRGFLSLNQYLEKIVDFNGWQVFEGATTYSCITILNKSGSSRVQFTLVDKLEKIEKLDELRFEILDASLFGSKEWRLLSKIDTENILRIESIGSPLFKYVDKFITGVATLNNDLFLIEETGGNDLHKVYRGKLYTVEKEITKKIIKPNKIKDAIALRNNKERIIYPYILEKSKRARIMPESFLRENFPKAYQYLCAIREDLELRDKGAKKYEAWYAYGRSQGLNAFGKKIILPMMNNKATFIVVEDPETLIYCGYAIYPKKNEDFLILEKILNSSLMWYYIKKTSKNYSGGFKSFAKNYVKKFSIPDLSEQQKKSLLSTTNKNTDHYLQELYGLTL